jgi:hypothetical protein
MAVTGHKSVQSLTTYQKVDTDEKIKMGQTISPNLRPQSAPLALPSTAPPAPTQVLQSLPPVSLVQDLVPVASQTTENTLSTPSATDHLFGINLDELLNDFSGTVQNNTL